MLEFLANPSESKLKERIRQAEGLSLLDAHMVLLTLALYERAQDDDVSAREHLDQVVETGPTYSIPRSWAIGLFKRWYDDK